MKIMQKKVETEKERHLELLVEIEKKKHEYEVARRPLIWYRNIVISILLILIVSISILGIYGNNSYIAGWCTFINWIFVLLLFGLVLHFFNIFYYIALIVEYSDDKFGFQGVARIKNLNSIKDEIEGLTTTLRILEQHQAHWLSTEEQYLLYKNELLQAIRVYQRKANWNRWTFFIMQIIIIACSLFVGSLTSGLTGLINIFGNHWLAPAFSFTVSFLTTMVTLFRPRERGYNLQQTADAIQYEIDCANRRIYVYRGLTDREAYTRLAEEVERLRNEQRKRQQQLEQASDTKQITE